MNRLLAHLRSQGIAYLALFVALCGTAYAASLPSNSVGTKQLKKGAVTKKKIKADAVTTGKVKDSTLKAQDFAPGVLLKGATGATGPKGDTGGVDTTILWAVVTEGSNSIAPVLVRGKHAVSTARIAAGAYEVRFDRDVSNCAYEATIGGGSPVLIAGNSVANAVNVNPKSGASDTVFVNMSHGSTISTIGGHDAPFHLLVAC